MRHLQCISGIFNFSNEGGGLGGGGGAGSQPPQPSL